MSRGIDSVEGSEQLRLFAESPDPEAGRRLLLRLSAASRGHVDELAWARAVCAATIEGYWGAMRRRHASVWDLVAFESARDVVLGAELTEAAHDLGRASAGLPVVEAADLLGTLYAALLPEDHRARHGVYFTPPALVARLLDQAESAGLDWRTARVLDPACGAGMFLVAAAARMLDVLAEAEPAIAVQNVAARLQGWDLDPFSAWLSQVFLESILVTRAGASARRPQQMASQRDSLEPITAGGFDLVVGNPPYGRCRLEPDRRSYFRRGLYGHANLYGLFMDQAIRLTRPGALVSLLTPASFLGGEYFKSLRALLSREAPPVQIDFVDARREVFDGVLQETVLATYHRRSARATEGGMTCRVRYISRARSSAVQVELGGDFVLPVDSQDPWLLPRTAVDAEFAARLGDLPGRLRDWGYSVSTGPLVWNRHKHQLRDEPGPGCIPLVWAECIGSDGTFTLRCEKRNHRPFIHLGPSDGWLRVDKSCVLLQRTTAREQSRRLVAAEMPGALIAEHGGVSVENHVNMLLPQQASPLVAPAVLAAFLNTQAADRAFRCLSGSVAVSAYELEAMPLPSPEALSTFRQLVEQGAPRLDLEREAARVYESPPR